jgi:hypothetical protein
MKISTGCKITRLGRTAKSVAYLAYTRRPTLKQEIKGSKHNHERHLCGIIQAGDAGPGIDSPRRFDRGAIIIWIYEALVWVGVQHLMPLAGIPRNATGLVFGKQVQEQLGTADYFVGTGIHFLFALAWGRSPEIHTPRRGHGFRTRAELVIGPRFARTRWRAPE